MTPGSDHQVTLEGVPSTDRGGIITTDIHPLILSASRETDIPAFYLDWFLSRMKAGYFIWKNPYNQKRQQRVLTDRCRGIVFWTKDPGALVRSYEKITALGVHWYAEITLNQYDPEGYEPGVPPLRDRVAAFQELSRIAGPDRVVWRFDPLLLSDRVTLDVLLDRISLLYGQLAPYTRRFVFSFIDIAMYRGVTRNLGRSDRTGIRELDAAEQAAVLAHLVRINTQNLLLMACCEGDIAEKSGIVPGRCIDDRIFSLIGADDPVLLAGLKGTGKAKGQRPHCTCIESKDIGEYSTCPHRCRYCYANRGDDLVMARYHLHRRRFAKGADLPSIVPDAGTAE